MKAIHNSAIWDKLLTGIDKDKLVKMLKSQNFLTGVSDFNCALEHIKDPAIWDKLLTSLDKDKIAEFLLPKNPPDGRSGFEFAVKHIKDPAIWDKLLARLDKDKVAEMLRGQCFGYDRNTHAGFQHALEHIKDPAIWVTLISKLDKDTIPKMLVPSRGDTYIIESALKHISDPAIWDMFLTGLDKDKFAKLSILIGSMRKETRASLVFSEEAAFYARDLKHNEGPRVWKYYLENPKDSIRGNLSSEYLTFLERATEDPTFTRSHRFWIEDISKCLSCKLTEDKIERLQQLYVRVYLQCFGSLDHFVGTERNLLQKYLLAIKNVEWFSGEESFKIVSSSLFAEPIYDKVSLKHLQNAEAKDVNIPQSALLAKKHFFNTAEEKYLSLLKKYVQGVSTSISFFSSTKQFLRLKVLCERLEKSITYPERMECIKKFTGENSSQATLTKYPEVKNILTSLIESYELHPHENKVRFKNR